MNKITVKLKKVIDESYDVIIGRNHIKNLPAQLHALGNFSKHVIITDSTVKKLYGNKLASLLKRHGHKTLLLSFPPGEKSKIQKTKNFLESEMLRKGCNRDTLIVALGGGVVGDMAGFVAATYMRGIPYVQIPTTLVAMVDSAVGGKTGIDTPQGKNLIGAFWQPKKIFIDLDIIKTLPARQVLNGYYEIVKIALTSDKKLFEYAEQNLLGIKQKKLAVLQHLVTEGLKIKAGVVERDEKESNDRMILNFGHTIGHALEKLSGYKLLHGYAVALGIIAESKISALDGLLSQANFKRIESLLVKSGVDISTLSKFTPTDIIQAAKSDKKTRDGRLRVVLIKDIGQLHRKAGMAASFVGDKMIRKALTALRS